MSSTNRGQTKRAELDYYVTPQKCIKEFLSEWLLDMQQGGVWVGDRPDRVLWCDPCAGGDSRHAMSYPSVLQQELGASVMTIDIRQDSLAEIKADYLNYAMLEPRAEVIITNPPFSIAQEIIEKALRDVATGGYVVMLLRLNFLESKARKDFFTNNMPERIYVHHKRLSFTDNGKSDSIAHAHFVWKKGAQLTETKLKII